MRCSGPRRLGLKAIVPFRRLPSGPPPVNPITSDKTTIKADSVAVHADATEN